MSSFRINFFQKIIRFIFLKAKRTETNKAEHEFEENSRGVIPNEREQTEVLMHHML
jgi:hypothetical protein